MLFMLAVKMTAGGTKRLFNFKDPKKDMAD